MLIKTNTGYTLIKYHKSFEVYSFSGRYLGTLKGSEREVRKQLNNPKHTFNKVKHD
jgi:hypothetical protein